MCSEGAGPRAKVTGHPLVPQRGTPDTQSQEFKQSLVWLAWISAGCKQQPLLLSLAHGSRLLHPGVLLVLSATVLIILIKLMPWILEIKAVSSPLTMLFVPDEDVLLCFY